MSEMQELTTERDTVTGTVPYQFRPFIYVNKQRRIRLSNYFMRPRYLLVALLVLAGLVVAAARLIGGTK